MSDMGDTFRSWKDGKKKLRAAYGVPCPKCVELLPKACPTILLPSQACRIHKYRDPRPRLTDDEHDKVTGWKTTYPGDKKLTTP